MFSPSVTQSDALAALRSFLLGILPAGNALFTGSISGTSLTVATLQSGTINIGDQVLGQGVAWGTTVIAGSGLSFTVNTSQTVDSTQMATGVPVIQGQDNRVPEPENADFVVMTPIMMPRLALNIDTYLDDYFTASIAATTMTVTAVGQGSIAPGDVVFSPLVTSGTRVVNQLTGTPGGTGTYQVTPSQTVVSGTVYLGEADHLQALELTVQTDFHGPASMQTAQVFANLFRDSYASDFFGGLGVNVAPLYCDDPKQLPFENAEQQTENRWSVDAKLQLNSTVATPQQFADVLTPTVIPADVIYPLE